MNERIEHCEVTAFTVPTDSPESDGTLEWDSTTLVLVQLRCGRTTGLGYTYSHESCVPLIREKLFSRVKGEDPMSPPKIYAAMTAAVRNFGRRGIASTAIAAVDNAAWDLKARLLGRPLVELLGAYRKKIPVYGSGGFTSYSKQQLRRQLAGWVDEGISMVKMKVGRQPDDDPLRVKWARSAIGRSAQLFVDGNGAYSLKQALSLAHQFAGQNVTWFEEPVGSDNLTGLRFIRERAPVGMEISSGEYNYDVMEAHRMLEAQAVDVLQSDATRCGVSGFLRAAKLCEVFDVPMSSHTAPALHAHLCCAARNARHAEYFHDHVRIEQMFFDGATTKHENGFLQPDLSQPGFGLQFKAKDASRFQI
ncbi:MAG TPA: enolase C-terminal domain-like protein [Verrucomicrobiae bacterium]|nr:enolase C-terminal domain-like protein [Verrucomicrobiae bacterium]